LSLGFVISFGIVKLGVLFTIIFIMTINVWF